MPDSERLPSFRVPYCSVFIDASLSDFTFAMQKCFSSADPNGIEQCKNSIEGLFMNSVNENLPFVCLSVRTAFDLYLTVQNFPEKSQVIMSAINIPSMEEIVRLHGLTPVAWDVDSDTMSPKLDQLMGLINERTVAVVLAHVFGRRCDPGPFLVLCRDKNVRFIEDCAEIFFGFDYLGHPDSDLSLFSFGVIKNFTCFGGALAKIRCPETKRRMQLIYADYPPVSNLEYCRKIAKYAFLALGLNSPAVATVGIPFFRTIDVDHKRCATAMLRAFPSNLLTLIRRQPPPAMLYVMLRRFKQAAGRTVDFEMSRSKALYVAAKLSPCPIIRVPGLKAHCVNFWLFPLIVDVDPSKFVSLLNALGVDAFASASQLSLVGEKGRFETGGTSGSQFLHRLIYLPVHKNVPYEYLDKICRAVTYSAVKLSNNGSMRLKCKL